jgi:hypothetical protein
MQVSVLAFSGESLTSVLIAIATGQPVKDGITHVAITAEYNGECLVFESTTLEEEPCIIQGKRVSGVQAHSLDMINKYPGHIWEYSLAEPLTEAESKRLTAFLVSKIGTSYDAEQAVASAGPIDMPEDMRELFCSEYVAMALREIGRVKIGDCSALNPIELIEVLRDQGVVLDPVKLK